MIQIQFFYEIELKSVLDKSQYDRLSVQLPLMMRKTGEDTIFTTRYRSITPDDIYMPGDIRLRHSDKVIEMVYKEGEPTQLCRKELVIPLDSMGQLEHLARKFESTGLVAAPPWTKHKVEFECDYRGSNYCVCLQDIKDFAYILEVEYMSKKDDSQRHLVNLVDIVKSLGLTVCHPKDFEGMIRRYVESRSDQTY